MLDCPHRPHMTLVREIISLIPGDRPFFCNQFSAFALVHQSVGEIGRPFSGVIFTDGVARHHLRPASQHQIHITGDHRLCGEVHRLLAGAAHPVQRHSRHMRRETGFQCPQPGQVGALITHRGDHAPDHIIELIRIDAPSPHCLDHHHCSQVNRQQRRQSPLRFSHPHRGADCGYNKSLTHRLYSLFRLY